MAGLLKREHRSEGPMSVFDRFFDDWRVPFARPELLARGWFPDGLIRVDEFRENGSLVVRAELPGIDPEEDVELTVADGVLHIEAERREEEKTEEKGYMRKEMRYGSFERTLPLPAGVTEADITASYKDGILEIRIPAGQAEAATKIPITKS